MGSPFHTQRNYYDYETVTLNIVDDNGKVLSTSSRSRIMYENGIIDSYNILFSDAERGSTKIESWTEWASMEGDGGTSSRGGFTLVTNGNVVSPTKFKTNGETRTINVDLLVAALGGINGGRGQTEKALYFADATTKVVEVVEGLNNLIETNNQTSTQTTKDHASTDSCTVCNQIGRPEKFLTEKWHGEVVKRK
jgi:hypothetical protein